MRPETFLPALGAATLITLTATASAKTVCMSAHDMEASLIDWYAEAPVEGSKTNTTSVWASEQGGSWTLLQYLADGQACVLAQGNDWGSDLSEDLIVAALDDQ